MNPADIILVWLVAAVSGYVAGYVAGRIAAKRRPAKEAT